ncbi:MAG TPA: glycoside hydrolase family 47 protein [Flavobacteriales bacterium]
MNIPKPLSFLLLAGLACGCAQPQPAHHEASSRPAPLTALADEVKQETLRSWKAYRTYAWGHDALKPLSRSFEDWYAHPLYISPIDAYSTLKVMGLDEEAADIERYVVDSLSWDKDVDAKTFEVDIRILGGLLSMYEYSANPKVLAKTVDFADRLLKAFDTPTGIPTYSVNLRTGKQSGDTVNVAEAATNILELGILSHYTGDPKYYAAGKRATLAIHERRSAIGLVGTDINVRTGAWTNTQSSICAGVDSYFEYLYKAWVLLQDPDLERVWKEAIAPVHTHLPVTKDGLLWYGRSDMETGKPISSVVTLYDAFFPALMVLSGDTVRAEQLQRSWDALWRKYGLEPTAYDYATGEVRAGDYDLNPEIIESAYYLYHATGDTLYRNMARSYWSDIKEHCRTDVAFTSVSDVRTMAKKDYMPTFFFAETMKYLYLVFSEGDGRFDLDAHIFNTEAHPFRRSSFEPPARGPRH